MAETVVLEDLVRRAGAVAIAREGRRIPLHYGSASAELSVCVSGVGIAVRSDLLAASITGAPRSLELLIDRCLSLHIAPGHVARVGAMWWCRSAHGSELTLVSPAEEMPRVRARLDPFRLRWDGAEFTTCPDTTILSIVGRMAPEVVGRLGVDAGCGGSLPYQRTTIGGTQVAVALDGRTGALILTDSASAVGIWRRLERAGRPFGISCVGLESITRYELMRRRPRSHAAAAAEAPTNTSSGSAPLQLVGPRS